MRIFVTGATGYIGSAVVRALVDAGHEVSGLSRSEERDLAVRGLRATPVRGALGRHGAASAALAGFDTYHGGRLGDGSGAEASNWARARRPRAGEGRPRALLRAHTATGQ
jgi:uncharacterized protein YbjT (DUF2867 family)